MRLILVGSVVVAALLGGCAVPAPKCDSRSCAGCCDDTGACDVGNTLASCGSLGNGCQVCRSYESCTLGQCSLSTGTGGGGGATGGEGGSTGGGTGGGTTGGGTVTGGGAGAAHLRFQTSPSNTGSQTLLRPVPVVVVEDGAAIVTSSSAPVTVAITPGSCTATLDSSSLVTVNAAQGVASFYGLKISTVATGCSLTATSGSLQSAASTAFDIQ